MQSYLKVTRLNQDQTEDVIQYTQDQCSIETLILQMMSDSDKQLSNLAFEIDNNDVFLFGVNYFQNNCDEINYLMTANLHKFSSEFQNKINSIFI